MKELSLKEIQDVMLENLKYLHTFCEDHNLTYYLAYGSLLGAIRHKGFIPWDDDADIWMPRKDYDKLFELFNEGALEVTPYKLCTRKNVKNYPYGITRFSNMQYSYVSTLRGVCQFDIGIFVDIYPIDNCGNSMEEAQALVDRMNVMDIEYDRYLNWQAHYPYKTIFKILVHLYYKAKFGPHYSQVIDDKKIEYIRERTSDEDKYIGIPVWRNYKTAYPREVLKDRIQVEFEGAQFYAPAAYDFLLREWYGDYMKLPPKEEQMPDQHGYKIYKKSFL